MTVKARAALDAPPTSHHDGGWPIPWPHARPPLHPALATVLIGLLASCPIVCGTSHSSNGCAGSHRHDEGGSSPLPAPANDDDCLCNGALKASSDRPALDGPTDRVDYPVAPASPFASLRLPARSDLPPAGPLAAASGGRGTARLPFLRC